MLETLPCYCFIRAVAAAVAVLLKLQGAYLCCICLRCYNMEDTHIRHCWYRGFALQWPVSTGFSHRLLAESTPEALHMSDGVSLAVRVAVLTALAV